MKFKMAAIAILNLLFLFILVKCSISGSSRLHHCKISFLYVDRRPSSPFKFRVDQVRTFQDIAIRKFRKFGLKLELSQLTC